MASVSAPPLRGRSDRADRLREAAIGLAMVAPPIAVLLFLIVLPALQATIFSLGIVPSDNLVFSTGQHLIKSDSPTLDVYRDLLASPFVRDDLGLTMWITIFSMIFVAIVGYVLRVAGLIVEGPLLALRPDRAPGLFVVAVGLVGLARATFEIYQEPEMR